MKELLSFLSSKTQKAWQKALEEITQTPFVKGLITGDLPASVFTLYLQQDAWYLHKDATLFLNLARKCTKERKEEEAIFFQKMAEDDIATEQAMENYFFEKYQLSPAKQILPTLLDYVAFLKQTLENETSEMAIAALFPCFGLYSGMTYYICQRANTENKYQDWIETYKNESYTNYTLQFETYVRVAYEKLSHPEQQQMEEILLRAARYEIAFLKSISFSG